MIRAHTHVMCSMERYIASIDFAPVGGVEVSYMHRCACSQPPTLRFRSGGAATNFAHASDCPRQHIAAERGAEEHAASCAAVQLGTSGR